MTTDADAADRKLLHTIEHELAAHEPTGGVCGECGATWPCDPVLNAAIALDVKWGRS